MWKFVRKRRILASRHHPSSSREPKQHDLSHRCLYLVKRKIKDRQLETVSHSHPVFEPHRPEEQE